jgi:ABC-type multidrug transport system ATPase subunit
VVHELSKSFDGRPLFEGAELQVTGGERIALIGDNGTGKSTFLSILMGLQAPDRGSCRFGPAVKTAMLEQQVHFAHMDRNLVDTMLYEGDCTPQQARDRLGAFGFSGEDAFKLVGDLSGGELSRLRLCILMKEDVNFLILDEPTNHLDIISREWMEDALTDYSEALLFVSHDRWFISRFATRIWELEDGVITDWRCSFEEYRARKERLKQAALAKQAEEKKQLKKEQPKKERPAGGQKALQKKLTATEREIAALEARLKEIETAVEENATDYEALSRLFEEKAAAEAELEEKYEDWGALSEELEGLS